MLSARERAAAEEDRALLSDRDRVVAEERQRLARELHDTVSQTIYGIALGARSARVQMNRNAGGVAEALDYVVAMAEAALGEMRALILELRPDNLLVDGLVATLGSYLPALGTRHCVTLEVVLGEEPQIPVQVKEVIHRVAVEAVHNSLKHAGAGRIEVRILPYKDGLLLEVRDDGCGFDATVLRPGHLGLRSMRERASDVCGHVEIVSRPGEGTCVRLYVPS